MRWRCGLCGQFASHNCRLSAGSHLVRDLLVPLLALSPAPEGAGDGLYQGTCHRRESDMTTRYNNIHCLTGNIETIFVRLRICVGLGDVKSGERQLALKQNVWIGSNDNMTRSTSYINAESLLEALSISRVEGKRTRYLSFLIAPLPVTTAPILTISPNWSMLSPSQSLMVPVRTSSSSSFCLLALAASLADSL